MFTTWQQVEEWILSNGLEKWVFYRRDPISRDKGENIDKIVDSSIFNEELPREEKMLLTKKNLEAYGDTCYGIGYTSEKSNKGSLWCRVQLSSNPGAVGVTPQTPIASPVVDEAALADRIRKEMQVEFDRREYERERKDFERERKEFNDARNSTLGAIIGYLQPYLPALNAAIGKRAVAGLDTEADVKAARIIPTEDTHAKETQQQEQQEEESIFTDEESDKLYELMSRFKAVEPDYLKLIESVVVMAESGDGTYTMAKNFLLK